MNILVLIQVLFTVIRMLPQIIQVIHAIIELIDSLKEQPGFVPRQALRELSVALRYARLFKDTSKLEALHAKLATAYGSDPASMHPIVSTPDSVANELKALGRKLGENESNPLADGSRKE